MITKKQKPAPQQTYALVVGIEKYDAGSSWNLDGPAHDAVKFANWLLSEQVPAEHILLFLAPLEENQTLLAQVPLTTQTATLSNIYNAITKQLLQWQGELLYIFWGGHGILTLEGSERLFCADATQETRLNLDLTSLLIALRSTYFMATSSSASRFPQQVCIIDACRSYERRRETTISLPGLTFAHGEPLRRPCEQFVLFATKPGSAAANRNALKTGRFSEIVLQVLATTHDQWPPDMEQLAMKAQDYFQQLRTSNTPSQISQMPTYYSFRNGDGSGGSLGNLATGEHQDWGDATAIDGESFYGRTEELATLEHWVTHDQCKLVAILGIGGIGKTTLVRKLAEQLHHEFEYLIWRSLRDKPPVNDVLIDLLEFLSDQQDTSNLPEIVEQKVTRLLHYLREHRCLIVLDNVESIFHSGERTGIYTQGYEGYGELIKKVAEITHRSCLLLTSREEPPNLTLLEGRHVRLFQLNGLSESDGALILKEKGVSTLTANESKVITEHYAGNPLALKIAAAATRDLLDGNATSLVERINQGEVPFSELHDLLERQFERLSAFEQDIMYHLAVEREATTISNLEKDLIAPEARHEVLNTLLSLRRRSMIARGHAGFTLQPAVMEYVTDRFVNVIFAEVCKGNSMYFNSHALVKAQAKDYIRDAQFRLLLTPLLHRLLHTLGGERNVINQLVRMLAKQREYTPRQPGYTGGNGIHLLSAIKATLSNYDFSHLTIKQAYLRDIKLHNVNFSSAHLENCAFTQNFGIVLSVAFSPDERFLATGDNNGEIRLWQIENGQLLLTYNGHNNWVRAIAFSPDGTLLASCGDDQTIRIWLTETAECLFILHGHSKWIWSVAFSPDGQTLASCSEDKTVKLWNVANGQCLETLQEHSEWVEAVCFSPDGRYLVSGGDDLTIRVWDRLTRQYQSVLRNHHTAPISSLAFNATGTILASGSEDKTIKLWDISTDRCLETLQGHDDWVRSLAFNATGTILASGSEDKTIKLWNVATGECFQTLQGHTNRVWSIAFAPTETTVASGSADNSARLWDGDIGRSIRTFQGYTNWIRSLAFSPDGKTIASNSSDQSVRLWDVVTGECLKTFQEYTVPALSVAFSPDGHFLVTGSADDMVGLWDVKKGDCFRKLIGHNQWVHSAVFGPDGQLIASASDDKTIKLWDARTGTCLNTLQGHTDWVWQVVFDATGQTMATASSDSTIKLWDTQTGACLNTLRGHSNRVRSVAFSPDRRLIVSGSDDRTVKLWDTSDGQCLTTFQEPKGRFLSVAFHPAGQLVAGVGDDTIVWLWDVTTGQCVQKLRAHTDCIWWVAFSPDGQLLASGSEDETIILWDMITYQPNKTLRLQNPYQGMNINGVTGLSEAQKVTLKALGAVETK